MSKFSSGHFACLLLASCSVYGVAQAQQTPHASFPDSPGVILAGNPNRASADDTSSSNDSAAESPLLQQSNGSSSPSGQSASDQLPPQTKRILGIIPNFRAVSANTKLPPQSPKEKLLTATQDSFDYSALFIPAFLAGYGQATNQTPEFHQGAAGYARYYWHSFVDQAIENYMVEAIVPIITHQDNRYYTLGQGGFIKRTKYALTRAVVTRNDAGKETFNTSEIIGAGAAAGISNLYYPSPERTFSNTAQKWGINVGIDAGTFVFKEFWPDINKALFHTKD
ncbi:MAG TPA: hypothetical protein VK684_13865 [Edaphobacter sp.]|jgi:hypothetical protein|nr:hypothetical protein [Edaphobacter sp.]